MYSDCYLKEDVNAVTDEKQKIVQTCVNIIQVSETASFEHMNSLSMKLEEHLLTLKAYHNKKVKRDEFDKISSLNKGIRI